MALFGSALAVAHLGGVFFLGWCLSLSAGRNWSLVGRAGIFYVAQYLLSLVFLALVLYLLSKNGRGEYWSTYIASTVHILAE